MQADITKTIAPIVTLMELYACPVCRMAWTSGSATERYAAAQRCCAPKVCACGIGIEHRGYTKCSSCRARDERLKWEKADRVDVATLDRYMIWAPIGPEWFHDLEDFLEWCEDREVLPWDAQPWLALFQRVRVPNLYELIEEDLPEDWSDQNEGWLADVQAQLEAAIEKNDPGAYYQTNKVPVLPTPEEWAGIQAKGGAR